MNQIRSAIPVTEMMDLRLRKFKQFYVTQLELKTQVCLTSELPLTTLISPLLGPLAHHSRNFCLSVPGARGMEEGLAVSSSAMRMRMTVLILSSARQQDPAACWAEIRKQPWS